MKLAGYMEYLYSWHYIVIFFSSDRAAPPLDLNNGKLPFSLHYQAVRNKTRLATHPVWRKKMDNTSIDNDLLF